MAATDEDVRKERSWSVAPKLPVAITLMRGIHGQYENHFPDAIYRSLQYKLALALDASKYDIAEPLELGICDPDHQLRSFSDNRNICWDPPTLNATKNAIEVAFKPASLIRVGNAQKKYLRLAVRLYARPKPTESEPHPAPFPIYILSPTFIVWAKRVKTANPIGFLTDRRPVFEAPQVIHAPLPKAEEEVVLQCVRPKNVDGPTSIGLAAATLAEQESARATAPTPTSAPGPGGHRPRALPHGVPTSPVGSSAGGGSRMHHGGGDGSPAGSDDTAVAQDAVLLSSLHTATVVAEPSPPRSRQPIHLVTQSVSEDQLGDKRPRAFTEPVWGPPADPVPVPLRGGKRPRPSIPMDPLRVSSDAVGPDTSRFLQGGGGGDFNLSPVQTPAVVQSFSGDPMPSLPGRSFSGMIVADPPGGGNRPSTWVTPLGLFAQGASRMASPITTVGH